MSLNRLLKIIFKKQSTSCVVEIMNILVKDKWLMDRVNDSVVGLWELGLINEMIFPVIPIKYRSEMCYISFNLEVKLGCSEKPS